MTMQVATTLTHLEGRSAIFPYVVTGSRNSPEYEHERHIALVERCNRYRYDAMYLLRRWSGKGLNRKEWNDLYYATCTGTEVILSSGNKMCTSETISLTEFNDSLEGMVVGRVEIFNPDILSAAMRVWREKSFH